MTILSDSILKHITNLKHTIMQVFRDASITRIQNKISNHMTSVNFKYTILFVGTNDLDSKAEVGGISSLYNNLITYIQSKSKTSVIVCGILPRPCDLSKDPQEKRVKDTNKGLISLCKMRNLQFLHTYRPFLHNNNPIRSYFAVKDTGLHLNLEGSRRLRLFFMNTINHLK